MIDTDKYEGHTEAPWTLEHLEDDEGQQWFEVPAVHYTTKQSGDGSQQEYADTQLIADAPLLLAEIKRLRKEINQLPIDLHESLDMILETHHPEVKESVMAMFGDAWGNNVVGYEE